MEYVIAGVAVFILVILGAGLLLISQTEYKREAKEAKDDAENLKKQRDVKPSGNVLSAIDRLRKNRK